MSEPINGPVELAASSDAELEQLMSEYRYRKTKVAEETERLDVVKSRLKARLQEAANGAEKVLLHAEGGKPVSLTYKESWRLDSARLKKENPAVWVQYAKKTGNWELREER